MAAPILTIRGRGFSEPMLWAIGGAVAFLTPLPTVVPMLLLRTWATTEGFVLPLVVLLAGPGLLTWWAVARPNAVSVRAWSVGLWATAVTLTFIVLLALVVGVQAIVALPDWLWKTLTVGFAIAVIFVASPFFAWAAFILGQRWFVGKRRPLAPTEPPAAS